MADHSHQLHDEHAHGEFAHVVPMKILLGVWGTLMFLTIITVLATRVDFGAQLNLLIAMVIATIKAGFVVLYFMHLRYDKLFHSVLFLAGLLAAILFVGFALMDSGQYQDQLIWGDDEIAAPSR